MTSNISHHPERNEWLTCEDDKLLKECRFTEFQSSGPGGQKRNRKYSSVRLTHLPSSVEVTAVKSRSQNTNKRNALRKLRCQLAMHIRCQHKLAIPAFDISLRNSQYPCLLAAIFDALHACNFSVGDAGKQLGISTGKLIKLLSRDKEAWQIVNAERQKCGLSSLKA